MKTILIAVLTLMLVGCGSVGHLVRDVEVDEVLAPYVDEFMDGCVSEVDRNKCLTRWRTFVEVKAVDGWVDGVPGRVGVCNTVNVGTEITPLKLKRTLYVMTSKNGKPLPSWRVKQVVWHELGHCALDLRHGDVALMQTDKPFISKSKIEKSWDSMVSEMWEAGRSRL